MGGNSFVAYEEGATVEEAFKKAVEQAAYDHGHSGYTGTIAEKTEFVIIPDSEWKGKYDAPYYANQLVSADDERINDKWGPAGAIKIKDGEWLFFGWASS